jgi:dTDP-4-dehydrorhamnose reductase
MRILLAGKNGQVGYELERSLQGLGEIIAVDRGQMDLSDLDQVRNVIRQIKPALIINAAAYTQVDKAEREPALAMRINGDAPGVMAEEAKKLGAGMIHYSTDYVFDGAKSTPYTEDDVPNPINVYGHTKLAGERAIQAAGIPHLILRTSWVYGMRGRNFLLTMLRLAQDRAEISVVSDQHGAPTWCRTIAELTAHIVAQISLNGPDQGNLQDCSGIYHLTARGQTTWAGFAEAIFENAGLQKPKVIPILAKDYAAAAPRPSYSVMSTSRLIRKFPDLPDWRHSLRLCQAANTTAS